MNTHLAVRWLMLVSMVIYSLGPEPLWANPTGGQVVAGSATISSNGNTLTVNQSTSRAIIDWKSFSIGAAETTYIAQPNSSSAELDRVISGNASSLLGSLGSNGQVYLINPNGIVFGKGFTLNTAGFLASTLDVSNAAFMAGGNLTFSGDSTAGITNNGTLTTTDGDVFLFASSVINNGTINANGTAGLAGGSDILLASSGDQRVFIQAGSQPGTVVNKGTVQAVAAELKAVGGNSGALAINNTGTIRATGVANVGGHIWLTAVNGDIGNSGSLIAQDSQGNGGTIQVRAASNNPTVTPATVTNSGTINASGAAASSSVGGSVVVTGDKVHLTSTSTVNVSGNAGGGTALIGGGSHGTDASVLDAQTTTVDAGSQIIADALLTGNGGKVVVWSNDDTQYFGNISAQGGSQSGNGGNVEVSGGYLNFQGTVNTLAPNGQTGDLLLDPANLTVVATGGTGTISGGTNSALDSEIDSSIVDTALNGTSVTLNATDTLTVNSGISWTGGSTLTLSTANPTANATAITINAPISGPSGGLTINATGVGNGVTTGADGTIQVANFTLENGSWSQNSATLPTFSATSNFTLDAGTTFLRVTGGTGTTNSPYQITDIYGLQGIGSPSGSLLGDSFILENNINASGTATWNGGAGFVPIGNNTTAYTGTFNGQDYTINGLAINLPDAMNVGLFGETGSGANLENVGLTNVQVSGISYVGGLVGLDGGMVEASYATGVVSGSSYVGGLAGFNGGTMGTSYATGTVSGSEYVGGLVGYNDGTVETSYATGSVSGSPNVGGLVGYNDGTVETSYATGTVTGVGGFASIGGLVGGNNGGLVETSYATGSVSGSSEVGGLVGVNGSGSTVETSYSIGAVSGTTNVGGLVGVNNGAVSTSYWANNVGGNTNLSTFGSNPGTVDGYTSGQTLSWLQVASNFDLSWNFATTWTTVDNTTTPLLQALTVTISGTTPDSNSDSVDLISGRAVYSTATASGSNYSFVVPDNVLSSGALVTDATTGEANTFYQLGPIPTSPITGVNLTSQTLNVVGTGVASTTQLVNAVGSLTGYGITYTVSLNNLSTATSGVAINIQTPYLLNGNLTTETGGTVTLDSAGNVTAPATAPGLITTGTLNLDGSGNVGFSGAPIDTEVGTLSLATTGGSVFINQTGALTLGASILGGTGNELSIVDNGSALTLPGAVNAAGNNVLLDGFSTVTSSANTDVLTASELGIISTGAINLDTAVTDLAIQQTAGGTTIDNTGSGGLSFANLSALAPSLATTFMADGSVTTIGPMNFMVYTGSTGGMTYNALATGGADNITIYDGVTVADNTSLTFNAGANFVIGTPASGTPGAGSNVEAPIITINTDVTNPVVPVTDPTGLISLNEGTLSGNGTVAATTITLNSGGTNAADNGNFGISQATGGSILATTLYLEGGGTVTLNNATNQVADLSTGTNTYLGSIAVADGTNLNLDDGTNGITTSSNISITAVGVTQDSGTTVNAGAGSISLNGTTGVVTLNGTITTTFASPAPSNGSNDYTGYPVADNALLVEGLTITQGSTGVFNVADGVSRFVTTSATNGNVTIDNDGNLSILDSNLTTPDTSNPAPGPNYEFAVGGNLTINLDNGNGTLTQVNATPPNGIAVAGNTSLNVAPGSSNLNTDDSSNILGDGVTDSAGDVAIVKPGVITLGNAAGETPIPAGITGNLSITSVASGNEFTGAPLTGGAAITLNGTANKLSSLSVQTALPAGGIVSVVDAATGITQDAANSGTIKMAASSLTDTFITDASTSSTNNNGDILLNAVGNILGATSFETSVAANGITTAQGTAVQTDHVTLVDDGTNTLEIGNSATPSTFQDSLTITSSNSGIDLQGAVTNIGTTAGNVTLTTLGSNPSSAGDITTSSGSLNLPVTEATLAINSYDAIGSSNTPFATTGAVGGNYNLEAQAVGDATITDANIYIENTIDGSFTVHGSGVVSAAGQGGVVNLENTAPQGNIAINQKVYADSNVTITSTGGGITNSTTGTIDSLSGNITLDAPNTTYGSIDIDGYVGSVDSEGGATASINITAGTTLTIGNLGAVAVNGTPSDASDGLINLTSGTNMTIGGSVGDGVTQTVTITNGGNLSTSNNAVVESSAVNLDGTGGILTTGSPDSAGLDLDAASLVLNKGSSTGPIWVSNSSGSLNVTGMVATDFALTTDSETSGNIVIGNAGITSTNTGNPGLIYLETGLAGGVGNITQTAGGAGIVFDSGNGNLVLMGNEVGTLTSHADGTASTTAIQTSGVGTLAGTANTGFYVNNAATYISPTATGLLTIGTVDPTASFGTGLSAITGIVGTDGVQVNTGAGLTVTAPVTSVNSYIQLVGNYSNGNAAVVVNGQVSSGSGTAPNIGTLILNGSPIVDTTPTLGTSGANVYISDQDPNGAVVSPLGTSENPLEGNLELTSTLDYRVFAPIYVANGTVTIQADTGNMGTGGIIFLTDTVYNGSTYTTQYGSVNIAGGNLTLEASDLYENYTAGQSFTDVVNGQSYTYYVGTTMNDGATFTGGTSLGGQTGNGIVFDEPTAPTPPIVMSGNTTGLVDFVIKEPSSFPTLPGSQNLSVVQVGTGLTVSGQVDGASATLQFDGQGDVGQAYSAPGIPTGTSNPLVTQVADLVINKTDTTNNDVYINEDDGITFAVSSTFDALYLNAGQTGSGGVEQTGGILTGSLLDVTDADGEVNLPSANMIAEINLGSATGQFLYYGAEALTVGGPITSGSTTTLDLGSNTLTQNVGATIDSGGGSGGSISLTFGAGVQGDTIGNGNALVTIDNSGAFTRNTVAGDAATIVANTVTFGDQGTPAVSGSVGTSTVPILLDTSNLGFSKTGTGAAASQLYLSNDKGVIIGGTSLSSDTSGSITLVTASNSFTGNSGDGSISLNSAALLTVGGTASFTTLDGNIDLDQTNGNDANSVSNFGAITANDGFFAYDGSGSTNATVFTKLITTTGNETSIIIQPSGSWIPGSNLPGSFVSIQFGDGATYTFEPAATINSTGAVTITRAGNTTTGGIDTAGNIYTTSDPVTFTALDGTMNVELTGTITIDTAQAPAQALASGTGGSVLFNATVNSETTNALTVDAGIGNITFADTVGAGGLPLGAMVLNSSGTTTFGADVAAESLVVNYDLDELGGNPATTQLSGTTLIEGGVTPTDPAVTTVTFQIYNNSVVLQPANGSTTTLDGDGIEFNGLVNSNSTTPINLVLNDTGGTLINNNVGTVNALQTLTINNSPTIGINVGPSGNSGLSVPPGGPLAAGITIETIGNQTYGTPVTTTGITFGGGDNGGGGVNATSADVLTTYAGVGDTTAGSIIFNSSLNGATSYGNNLVLTAGPGTAGSLAANGNIEFNYNSGNTTPLGNILITSADNVTMPTTPSATPDIVASTFLQATGFGTTTVSGGGGIETNNNGTPASLVSSYVNTPNASGTNGLMAGGGTQIINQWVDVVAPITANNGGIIQLVGLGAGSGSGSPDGLSSVLIDGTDALVTANGGGSIYLTSAGTGTNSADVTIESGAQVETTNGGSGNITIFSSDDVVISGGAGDVTEGTIVQTSDGNISITADNDLIDPNDNANGVLIEGDTDSAGALVNANGTLTITSTVTSTNAANGGELVILGGSVAGASATVESTGVQTVTVAGGPATTTPSTGTNTDLIGVYVSGGSGTGSYAALQTTTAGGNQSITADSGDVDVQGGNGAHANALILADTTQNITVNYGQLEILGDDDYANAGRATVVDTNATGVQTVNVTNGGILVQGGLANDTAALETTGTNSRQSITLSTAGNFDVYSGTGFRANATVQSNGLNNGTNDAQSIVIDNGNLNIWSSEAGTAIGNDSQARVLVNNSGAATQFVQVNSTSTNSNPATGNINLTGGVGTTATSGLEARLESSGFGASSGLSQSISAEYGITLTGGGVNGDGGGNTAQIKAAGVDSQQLIQVTGAGNITLNAGAGTDANAFIEADGINGTNFVTATGADSAQQIIVSDGNLALTGGSDPTSAGNAYILSTNSTATLNPNTNGQYVNVAGNITLQGGAGNSGNASIESDGFGVTGGPGVAQSITVLSNISLTGGTGPNSTAFFSTTGLNGTQNVSTSNGNLALLGGNGANSPAYIENAGLLQTIFVSNGNLTVTGNQTTTNGGSYADIVTSNAASNQAINVEGNGATTGNITVAGGVGNNDDASITAAGTQAIGGPIGSSTNNTPISGSITLQGGGSGTSTNSYAAITATSNQFINVTGNLNVFGSNNAGTPETTTSNDDYALVDGQSTQSIYVTGGIVLNGYQGSSSGTPGNIISMGAAIVAGDTQQITTITGGLEVTGGTLAGSAAAIDEEANPDTAASQTLTIGGTNGDSLGIELTGGSNTNAEALVFSANTQIVTTTGPGILVNGNQASSSAIGDFTNGIGAGFVADNNQEIEANSTTGLLELEGGTVAGSAAVIDEAATANSSATQTITSDGNSTGTNGGVGISLQGGTADNGDEALIYSNNTTGPALAQSIEAYDAGIDIDGNGANSTFSVTTSEVQPGGYYAIGAGILANNYQSIVAGGGNLDLTGGSNGNGALSGAVIGMLNTRATQTVTVSAGNLNITAGSNSDDTGLGSGAGIVSYGIDGSGSNYAQTISVNGDITLTAGQVSNDSAFCDAFIDLYADKNSDVTGATQSITSQTGYIALLGGQGANGDWAYISSTGAQTIAAQGGSLTGTNSVDTLFGATPGNSGTLGLGLAGGNGDSDDALVHADGTQQITVTTGDVQVLAGNASSGTNNVAGIITTGGDGGAQTITIDDGNLIVNGEATLIAPSQYVDDETLYYSAAALVGSAGAQQITVNGNITVIGGTGQGSAALIESLAAQTLGTGANAITGTITVQGLGGGTTTTNTDAYAAIVSNETQTINVLGDLDVYGSQFGAPPTTTLAASPNDNYGVIESVQDQYITVGGAVNVLAYEGSSVGSDGYGPLTGIGPYGHITGYPSTAFAGLGAGIIALNAGGAGQAQDITIEGSNLTVEGGSYGVGGTGALIEQMGATADQNIQVTAGNIIVQGGTDNNGYARIDSQNTQEISAAGTGDGNITVQGGGSGTTANAPIYGSPTTGAYAAITSTSNQQITTSANLDVYGSNNPTSSNTTTPNDDYGLVESGDTQTLTIGGNLVISADQGSSTGAGGVGPLDTAAGAGLGAAVLANNNQDIAVGNVTADTGILLVLGGTISGSGASLQMNNPNGNQEIDVYGVSATTGDSVDVLGGTTATGANAFASIVSAGGQYLGDNFDTANGYVDIPGNVVVQGGTGSGNYALIWADTAVNSSNQSQGIVADGSVIFQGGTGSGAYAGMLMNNADIDDGQYIEDSSSLSITAGTGSGSDASVNFESPQGYQYLVIDGPISLQDASGGNAFINSESTDYYNHEADQYDQWVEAGSGDIDLTADNGNQAYISGANVQTVSADDGAINLTGANGGEASITAIDSYLTMGGSGASTWSGNSVIGSDGVTQYVNIDNNDSIVISNPPANHVHIYADAGASEIEFAGNSANSTTIGSTSNRLVTETGLMQFDNTNKNENVYVDNLLPVMLQGTIGTLDLITTDTPSDADAVTNGSNGLTANLVSITTSDGGINLTNPDNDVAAFGVINAQGAAGDNNEFQYTGAGNVALDGPVTATSYVDINVGDNTITFNNGNVTTGAYQTYQSDVVLAANGTLQAGPAYPSTNSSSEPIDFEGTVTAGPGGSNSTAFGSLTIDAGDALFQEGAGTLSSALYNLTLEPGASADFYPGATASLPNTSGLPSVPALVLNDSFFNLNTPDDVGVVTVHPDVDGNSAIFIVDKGTVGPGPGIFQGGNIDIEAGATPAFYVPGPDGITGNVVDGGQSLPTLSVSSAWSGNATGDPVLHSPYAPDTLFFKTSTEIIPFPELTTFALNNVSNGLYSGYQLGGDDNNSGGTGGNGGFGEISVTGGEENGLLNPGTLAGTQQYPFVLVINVAGYGPSGDDGDGQVWIGSRRGDLTVGSSDEMDAGSSATLFPPDEKHFPKKLKHKPISEVVPQVGSSGPNW